MYKESFFYFLLYSLTFIFTGILQTFRFLISHCKFDAAIFRGAGVSKNLWGKAYVVGKISPLLISIGLIIFKKQKTVGSKNNKKEVLLSLSNLIWSARPVRVSVKGVKSLGGYFACLHQEFDFYEVKKYIFIILQNKKEILLHLQSFSN